MNLPTFEEVLQETINKYNDKHGTTFTTESIPKHLREEFYTDWFTDRKLKDETIWKAAQDS
jgi:hypothetical protein